MLYTDSAALDHPVDLRAILSDKYHCNPVQHNSGHCMYYARLRGYGGWSAAILSMYKILPKGYYSTHYFHICCLSPSKKHSPMSYDEQNGDVLQQNVL